MDHSNDDKPIMAVNCFVFCVLVLEDNNLT